MRLGTYAPAPKQKKYWPYAVAGVVVIVGLIWIFSGGDDESENQPEPKKTVQIERTGESENGGLQTGEQTPQSQPKPDVVVKDPEVIPPSDPKAEKSAPGPKGMTQALASTIGPSPITTAFGEGSPKSAATDFAQGMNLYSTKTDLLKARTLLNKALNTKALSEENARIARETLTDLANRTIFRKDSYVNPKDPYLMSYKFQSGDRLRSTRREGKIVRLGVIAQYHLNVPYQIIVVANGLRASNAFQAGRHYKLIKGPFHVVVYKSQRVADIYLQDLFVRRIPVCIGSPETPTPEGYFRLVPNGKTSNSIYTPPVDSGLAARIIRPGDPGYPLGPLGLNIRIEGIPELGTTIMASQAYALHGTADQTSLGKSLSRGCVRFGDKDIHFLYNSLMGYADPNDPTVTWSRWSTVTIKK